MAINNKRVALSHPQKRIWTIEQLFQNSSMNNIGGTIKITGNVVLSALKQAIHMVIKNNDSIRIQLYESNGDVYQRVSECRSEEDIAFIDFMQFPSPYEEYERWAREEAQRPFLVLNNPLYYFALFQLSDCEFGYFVKLHHIIADGWSMRIMTDQIYNSYMLILQGTESFFAEQPSYFDFIEEERTYLASERAGKDRSFWLSKLQHLPENLQMQTYHTQGRRLSFSLPRPLSDRLRIFVEQYKLSLNAFFVGAYLVCRYKTSHETDHLIGTPVLNRSGKIARNTMGMYISTMPFKYSVNEEFTMLEILQDVQRELTKCYYHQRYPYDLLVRELDLRKDRTQTLYNVCVNYYNTKLCNGIDGLKFENEEFYNGNQLYALQIIIREWSEKGLITLDFDYKVNDMSEEDIRFLYRRLELFIEKITHHDDKVTSISMLDRDEWNIMVYNFNQTDCEYPQSRSVIDLFEEQVKLSSEQIALSFRNKRLSYYELNARASELALFLKSKGAGRGTIVGLLTNHSIESIIGILGIMKAGAAYLPIDPAYPPERIGFILKDANVSLLISNVDMDQDWNYNGELISFYDYSGQVTELEAPIMRRRPSDLAYVIYTSGSTGKPKGTMIEDQGLVNYIYWARKQYTKGSREIFALFTSLSFDLTITCIFTPLISGGQIVVYQDDEEEYVLYRILKERLATVLKLTPSHLSLIANKRFQSTSVKRLVVGGENLKTHLCKQVLEALGEHVEIYNEYGPTETVVGCMIHQFNPEIDRSASVPIGVPADNVQIYLLDKHRLPVPAYTLGEIYIAGDGLARGYLNQPELTENRFVPNPFVSGRRMYRTGDLARFIPNTGLVYEGRMDQQVKIRGHRIELAEIEMQILQIDGVQDAIVLDCQTSTGDAQLVGYIVHDANISDRDVRHLLLDKLPSYMVPSSFVRIEEVPLTINGKVDRSKLPDLTQETKMMEEPIFELTDLQLELLQAFEYVLGSSVSLSDHFYSIGGDSIKAIQLSSRLLERGYRLSPKDIMEHPVIGEMTTYLSRTDIYTQETKEHPQGYMTNTPTVSWFTTRNFSNIHHYHQSVMADLKIEVDLHQIESALRKIIQHHKGLQMKYCLQRKQLLSMNRRENEFMIPVYDLTLLPPGTQWTEQKKISSQLHALTDIGQELLLKAALFVLEGNRKRLLLTAHHLVIDGISWRIILEDLDRLLHQLSCRQPLELTPATNSLQDWAVYLENRGKTISDEERTYWERNAVVSIFPYDHDLGKSTVGSSTTLFSQLNEEDTAKLCCDSNRAYHTETYDLLLCALLTAIQAFSPEQTISLELESHGREMEETGINVSRSVGWFTSIYPVNFEVGIDEWYNQIPSIKEQVRKIPGKGMNYGILRYMLNREEVACSGERIRFNYLGEFDAHMKNGTISLVEQKPGIETSELNELTAIMDINAMMMNGKLHISLQYSKNKFMEETPAKLLDLFLENLKQIIRHCSSKACIHFTPSDFDTVQLTQEELNALFQHPTSGR